MNNTTETVGCLIPSRKQDWGVGRWEVEVETTVESGSHPKVITAQTE
jgi:hypothetical protein